VPVQKLRGEKGKKSIARIRLGNCTWVLERARERGGVNKIIYKTLEASKEQYLQNDADRLKYQNNMN
jgi:hypothetical protein